MYACVFTILYLLCSFIEDAMAWRILLSVYLKNWEQKKQQKKIAEKIKFYKYN